VADGHDDDTSPWPPQRPEDAPTAVPLTGAPTTAAPAPPSTAAAGEPAPAASATSTTWVVPSGAKATEPGRTGRWDGTRIAGIILILVGLFLLVRAYVPLDSALLLPVVAIAIGAALVIGALRPRGRNG
jgi:hypothetical protein